MQARTPQDAVRLALTRYRKEFADIPLEIDADGYVMFNQDPEYPNVLSDADGFGQWVHVTARKVD